MIHRIYSSLKSFKALTFKPGLNLLLAERSEGASTKDTRNGAGKTSLIEIIHFLTGGKADKTSIFQHEALRDHEFGMEFDAGGATLSVQRSGSNPNEIRILRLSGVTDQWPLDPFREGNEVVLRNAEWATLLGDILFRLDPVERGPIKNYRPKFRALFAYFVRRESAKAFLDPVRQSEEQLPWDQHVMLSYLLGLDWTIPREWQLIRDREKALKELRKAAGGEFKEVIGTAADLRAELATAEERAARARQSAAEYRVLPAYREREQEAEGITRELRDLRNDNQVDRALILDIERALEQEAPPEVVDVEQVYREAGFMLPELALRRFEEVQQFHESVIANRRSYLAREMEDARQRVRAREVEMAALDRRRSEVFQLLSSHGALDQLTALQVELARIEAQATTLRGRFEAAQQLESTKAELDIERRKLLLRLQQDYQERAPTLRKAIVTLGGIVEQLYGSRPGKLLIDPTTNGPSIGVKIEGDRSKGIGNMEIFSFDVMLMILTAERELGPDFLVHDSHLFDGVDQRQRATALMVGKRAALSTGRQYIVTLNSDEFPDESERPEGFDVEADVLPVRLTDATETGGLFGLRFD